MMLERAIGIALEAHSGQLDKGSAPYILHPLRIMLRARTEEERITAVLHDVLEDNGSWTVGRLREEGISEAILEALQALTKRAGEDYEGFIERVCAVGLARRVKQLDIEDNMDLTRIPNPGTEDRARVERYSEALRRLQTPGPSSRIKLECDERRRLNLASEIDAAIEEVLAEVRPEIHRGASKFSRDRIEPRLEEVLRASDLDVERHARTRFATRRPVWRDASLNAVHRSYLEPDLSIFDAEGELIGLIESEADLAHVGTKGTYAAFPLGESTLRSYHPIERMAAVAQESRLLPRELVLRVVVCWAREDQVKALEPRCEELGVEIRWGRLF